MTEWKPFDDGELPELDRPFHTKYGSDAEPNPAVLRTHREQSHGLAYLQRQDGLEWKDVNSANSGWIVRYCKWRYADDTMTESSSPSQKPAPR